MVRRFIGRSAWAGLGVLVMLAPTVKAEIEWAPSFEAAMERAQAERKFVMVDFYTTWCHWCRVLDQKTYSVPEVQALSERVVSVKVDADKRKEIAAAYGVSGFPTIAFLNPDGEVRKSLRGFQPPDKFIPLMTQIIDTRSQQYSLSDRAEQDPDARIEYAEVLALGGDHAKAAEQLDLVLPAVEPEMRADLELDRLIYLVLANGNDLGPVRSALDEWVDGNESHERRWEAAYYLARLEAQLGKAKSARTLYEQVMKEAPGRWFALDAERRLENLAS